MKPLHGSSQDFDGLAAFFNTLVPDYVGRTYRPLVARIRPWDGPAFAQPLAELSLTRANKRLAGYINMDEVARVGLKLQSKDNASIRFGVEKSGHGYLGERGDFCLVGGAIRDRGLTVFYRRLELIGGWTFDVVLIDHLAHLLHTEWKWVQIMAVQADVYALRDGSGEKERLFQRVQEIYRA
jgi:hypothetical protein